MRFVIFVIAVALLAWLFYRRKSGSRSAHHPAEDVSFEPLRLSPTPDKPWQGRQGEHILDGEKPNGAETWDEVYNRPVIDDLHFRIEYADNDGVVTEREIRPLSIHLVRSASFVYIKANCSLRGDVRTFHSDRIQSARNLKTNRPIQNLGSYLRSKY